ncbi:MAG: C4-dicarboxylate ABC transporter substrate-binding protein, partial [Alphaproteobacteria bacterium]
MATRADVPEEAVYQITRAIYENLPFLHNIHKATLDMSLESAIEGLPVPLHVGAARYYREAGLSIPERLVVD